MPHTWLSLLMVLYLAFKSFKNSTLAGCSAGLASVAMAREPSAPHDRSFSIKKPNNQGSSTVCWRLERVFFNWLRKLGYYTSWNLPQYPFEAAIFCASKPFP